MAKKIKIAVLFSCSMFLLLRSLNCYAGIEQYVKYLNGPFVVNHSYLSNQDKAFQNPSYTWSTINNLSVQDAVTLRVVDSVLITTSFSVTVTVKIHYYTSPDTITTPATDVNVNLLVNYVPGQGTTYQGIAAYSFTGAYKINVTVTGINNHSTTPPGLALRLSSSIVINRKYAFQPLSSIGPNYTPALSTATLSANWLRVTGAEEYDVEWTTINNGNDNYSVIDNRYLHPGNTDNATVTTALTTIFRNNCSRITTPDSICKLSMLSTDTYLVVRIRQVQYLTSGVREAGNWDYMQNGGVLFAIFQLNWHQQKLNWQYSAAYAEDGKKKEVVSYFDGSLRGRQTVTLNNTDNIAIAQENVYDEFGRPAASILPAPFLDPSGTAYLHYNTNFNRNGAGTAYNFSNISTIGSYCELTPDSLSTLSGASRYYSNQSDFYNHNAITGKKLYNSFIPVADRFPISLTQYTADNTGRIKVQGGVGLTFQPGRASPSNFSYTTKYYYAKPEQGELDQLFGNDAGFAEHYLKNMVVDPNGQLSVSYINASGKTIATALAGKAPSTVDTIPSYSSVSAGTKVTSLHILKPEQFVYNSSDMKLTATTTYLNAVIDTGRIAFSIQKLIDKFPGGADSICSNCFYQMSVKVTDDCGDAVAGTTTPVHIGKSVSSCTDAPLYSSSIPVNFQQIGEYYVTVEFALNRDTINYFTNNFIAQGLANGYIQPEAYYIKQRYLDSIEVSGCYSDCTTCYAMLGTQANFVKKVQTELISLELDSVAVKGTAFTNWANTLYNKLLDSCAAKQTHCYNPCQSVQDAMAIDVSPGGQYALFDSTGVATEPAINVIAPNWRTVFPVKAPSDPVYQADLVTLPDGTVTSPYDAAFTLPELIKYWKPQWALMFLEFHPEYCKLQFCNSMSAYESWDNQVQLIDLAANVHLIPGGSSLVYHSNNASDWLLSTDPLFQTGKPGSAYLTSMRNDLLNYSVNVMGITVSTDSLIHKNIMQVIDYNLYCSNTNGSTTNLGTGDNWNNCTPATSCRVLDKEWRDYRDYYLSLKQKYYDLLRTAACGTLCPIGQSTTYALPGGAPSNNDFSIMPDTGATAACPGKQSVVITRNATASQAATTLTLYYPPAMDNAGLTHSVHFNANVARMTFCVPDSIPVSSILIQNPAIQPPVIPVADSLYVLITDKQIARDLYTCPGYGTTRGKITYTTHVVVLNKFGQPTIASQDIYLVVKYSTSYDGVAGIPVERDFAINPDDSTTTDYTYIKNDQVEATASCAWVTQNISCVEYVVGSLLSSTGFHTQCTGFTDSIPQPPHVVCPAVYASKISRFPDTQNGSSSHMSPGQAQALSNGAKTAILQQAADACTGNVSTLMDSLKAGFTAAGISPTLQNSLRTSLQQVCVAGADSAHATGVSDIIGDTHHGTTAYNSFAAAMKGVLTTYLPNFTPALNPWLTPGPFPYRSPQQSSPKTISYSNPDICSLLSTLTARATAAGKTLYNYLVATYGAAMTLSLTDVSNLQHSCSNCKFILASDVTLPVFLDPAEKGCIKHHDFQLAVDTLNLLFGGTIDTTNAHYKNIFSNYLNQRFGFALAYNDYASYRAALLADTSATLCNQMPFQTAVIDSAGCLNNALEMAVANGKADYDNYIDSLRAAFRASYINTCKLAQANANLTAKQQTYHYTLYYYDQADNLVRTIPPEGLTFVDTSKFKVIDSTRAHEAINDCQAMFDRFAPPAIVNNTGTKNIAFNALSAAIGANANRAVEFWLYNPPVSGVYPNNQLIEETADHNYMFSLCISGTRINIDIYTSTTHSATGVTYSLTNHFAANIGGATPVKPWMHLVIQSANLAGGTLTCYLNGRFLAPLAGVQPCNCPVVVTGGATSVVYPDNYATVKHMRIYSRLMPGPEIIANAGNECLTPTNITGMAWYRFHVPTIGDSTTVAGNSTAESTLVHVYPLHILPTNYAFNSTNQVSTQASPDGGVNRFWYDLLSRLVISQNDNQQPLSNYSYSLYDLLGRITEVGQKNQTTVNISTPHYLTNDTIGFFNAAGTNSQITNTYYDAKVPAVGGHANGIASVAQSNLRKRVAASTYTETEGSPVLNATYYNYDIDGNVKTLWQEINGLYVPATNSGLRRIDYEYDLVSGKVNFVRYQDNQPDRFYYSYTYDADNRLTNAWSGNRDMTDTLTHSVLLPYNAKRDAHYEYYLHGPLARLELGDTIARVQGVNYAYTLQGWLKGVNSSMVNSYRDMGRDSLHVARDAYGYSLYYFGNADYVPIGGVNPFDTAPAGLATFSPLYNGNIAAMSTNINKLTDPWHYYTYKYDQLNRLRLTSVYKVAPPNVTAVNDYHEMFTYDGNGNIDSAVRYAGAGVKMDNLLYRYNLFAGRLKNNRLNYIHDAITTHTWPYGLDSQVANNYTYDAIGNLTADVVDTVSNINWTVYGKIQSLTNSAGTITYGYDPGAHRVTKTLNGVTTYYIRDAQGNTLAVYNNKGGALNWLEQDLYGSSRLGVWQPNLAVTASTGPELVKWDSTGFKEYELSNHLGNVWATITDKRVQHSTNGATVDYFDPDIATAQEYYAFGGLMPGRTFSAAQGNYRYGFNGKENDNDVKGTGNQQDYGMRIYDPRVGRFLSVDPLQAKYAGLTPYQFASNSPVADIDLDGLEKYYYLFDVNSKNAITYLKTVVQKNEESGWDAVKGIFHGLLGDDAAEEYERLKDFSGDAIKGIKRTYVLITPYGYRLSFASEKQLRKFDYLAYDRKTLDQQTTYIETGLLATPGELPGGVSSSATATEEQLLTDSKLMQNPNLESGELYTVPPGSNKSAAEAHNGSSEAITSNTATTKPNDLKRTESIGGNQSSRTVGYYIKQIRENKSIPPVEVAEINNELYVINGHHRLEAAIRTGRKIEFKILTKEELGKYGYKSETEVINASSNVVPVKLNNKIIKGVSSDSN